MSRTPRPNLPPPPPEGPGPTPPSWMDQAIGFLPAYARRRLDPTLSATRDLAADAQRSRLPQMAAALSYRTIFGLIPVIVVALVGLRAFAFSNPEDVTSAVRSAMRYAGLSSISVSEQMGPFLPGREPAPDDGSAPISPKPAPGPGTPDSDAIVPPPPPPAVSEKLEEWIVGLVTRVNLSFGAIGIIGAVLLIYAAVSMLVEIERSFNQIYRVPTGRSWARRVTQYWTLLTLGTLLLVATVAVGQQFSAWLTKTFGDTAAAQAISAGEKFAHRARFDLIGALTAIPVSTVLFLLLYTVVPNTRVRLVPAAAGAAFAAVLFEFGKFGFAQYIKYSTGYAQLYGAIALIPLFLVWVYVTWMIVLLGLQVAYYLQHGRRHTRAKPLEVTPAIVDPASILSLMGELARGFADGKAVAASDLAARLRAQPSLVGAMLDKLVAGGYVHRVEAPPGVGPRSAAYAPARPADRIDAEAVLSLGEALAETGSGATDPVETRLREARHAMVRGKTLAEFLALTPAGGAAGPERRPTPSVPLAPGVPLAPASADAPTPIRPSVQAIRPPSPQQATPQGMPPSTPPGTSAGPSAGNGTVTRPAAPPGSGVPSVPPVVPPYMPVPLTPTIPRPTPPPPAPPAGGPMPPASPWPGNA